MRSSLLTFVLFFGMCLPTISFSQNDTPDPNKIATDQAECKQQATTASGYNPDAPPPQASSQKQRGSGLRAGAKGALKGAAAGGIVKEVGDEGQHDDADEIGAALGAAKGVSKGRRASREQAAAAPPPATGDKDVYSKSFDDCMLSRGYIPQ